MEDTKQQEKPWLPDKVGMLDSAGKPITQSLFLETTYAESAIYTLKDSDYEYKGKYYPSIKRLFIEENDPLEYSFAEKYFLGWDHWNRIAANKLLAGHVESWRQELTLKLRVKAFKMMYDKAMGGSLQAIKWLADRGWDVREAGRPSKQEVEHTKKVLADQETLYEKDYTRLMAIK